MIRFVDPYFRAADERGSITGIINTGEWREINLIRSEPGMVRGKHYHKLTAEGFVILEGVIDVSVQRVQEGRLFGEKQEHRVSRGAVFIIDPMVYHEFHIAGHSVWMNFLSLPMSQAAPDICRIDVC